MKLYLIFIILILNFGFNYSLGQQLCGTEISVNDKKLIREFLIKIKDKGVSFSPTDSIVPVQFHIISYSDSTQGIDSASIYNEMQSVEEFYKGAGIVFQHCGYIQYIYDDEYADFEKITDETICDNNDLLSVLNIYFVPNLYKIQDQNIVSLCGYAYLTDSSKNRIIIRNSCSTNGSTLSHEIGHYFSLFHTHSSAFGAELVNGQNCSIAGDLLCDTPADPGLSSSNVTQGCTYIGTEQDLLGYFYNPNVRNIMSYSRKHCRDFFSIEQLNQMNAYSSGYRDYLKCNYNGGITDPTEDFEYIISPNPANDKIIITSNKSPVSGFHFIIFDITGKLILESTVNNNAQIPIYFLNYGCYFIIVYYEQKQKIKKFLKF